MMLDDTCYFIPFDNFSLAYTAMLLLNSKIVRAFLLEEAFLDAKRPYTKGILKKLSFDKILALTSLEDIVQTEQSLDLIPRETEQMYNSFKAVKPLLYIPSKKTQKKLKIFARNEFCDEK